MDYRVEGDYSQAAFFLCADAVLNEVVVNDLNLNSLQGDKEVIDILERMGVNIKENGEGIIGTVDKKLVLNVQILFLLYPLQHLYVMELQKSLMQEGLE